MGIPGGGAKGLKTEDDAAIASPPPPGPQGTLLDGAGCPGVKVFPRVDPRLLESAEEMNVGPRDEVFPRVPGLPCTQNALLQAHYDPPRWHIKSSKESKQRDSLCMLHAMSHSRLRVKGLSLTYSHTVGSTRL